MKYTPKLVAEKCYLSPISSEDYEPFFHWLNDMEIAIRLNAYTMYISKEVEKNFLDGISQSTDKDYIFSIVDKEKDQLLGNCGLTKIDWLNRSAEFGIFIGEKSYWGKGYGKEATQLLLDYGFNALNLHSIALEAFAFNQSAIRMYQKCGFRQIGIRREAKIIGTKKYDMILMDILAQEYSSVYLKNIMPD